MLEVTNLSARAGIFVLSNVSLDVLPSSCHVILGPTGSGKTLLLESVIGLRNPQAGKVILEGKEITCLPMERRGLSYVPQDLALFPHMTVRENILYPIRIRGGKQDIENGIVRELVESLGINHLLDRSVQNLSGGERQRTALARAVASGCKYLILDEPLSALHESLKKELWYLLKDLQRRYDLAILMVTHDLEEAFFLGDAISIIVDGKLHQQGPKREIHSYPETVEAATFLGVGNLFSARIDSIMESSLSVYCEELSTTLSLSSNKKNSTIREGTEFAVGIRPKDVSILTPGGCSSNKNNTIDGTVLDIFETGGSFTIIVACGNHSRNLEIDLRRKVWNELNLAKGQSIRVHLPEEDLLLLSDEKPR